MKSQPEKRNPPLVPPSKDIVERLRQEYKKGGIEDIFAVTQSALALAGFKALDGDRDTVIVRYAPTDQDFQIKITEIVP